MMRVNQILKTKGIYMILIIYVVIAIFTILFFNGTADAGDSITHYLFAKYALIHPRLFFDHWAKPVYVLLACPFAQFGFTGVKVFNAIVSLLTIIFTFKSAQKLNLGNPMMSAVILIFSPLYYIITYSGLTEPLFALIISISLFAVLKKKYITACLIISFLPFVRSEGLIIIGIFGFYFLLKKAWKLLPLLLFGHIVYSIAGFFIYGDFLWVFTKIPYARLNSSYGSGSLFHFVDQLIYVIGVPIYILFWIGFISIVWKTVKKQINFEVLILVFLGFLSFFIAHSLFWYFGIFNSMGLKRVLIGVIPLISIISLIGFNFIVEDIFKRKKNLRFIISVLLVTYILIFPFTPNPAAINWEKDMNLSKDQQSAMKVADYIVQNIGTDHRFIIAQPYLSEVLKIDYFDPDKRVDLSRDIMKNTKPGDVIIWENWFSIVECGITKKEMDNVLELINIYHENSIDQGREVLYAVYKRK